MTVHRLRLPLLLLAVAALRLCYIHLLWSDEDYHLTAALQILHGRVPYKDFWYDKPPLAALYYTLINALPGWPLRLLDVAYVLAACWLAYRLACTWWTRREGEAAALLLAFFTTFYLPAAVIPFAVDALLLVPHLAAILLAKQRRPLACGLVCAVGLLVNTKAIFIAAVCALWLASELPLFALGIAAPLAVAACVGWASGALPSFYLQVWQWGLLYAAGSSLPNATVLALRHCLDWLAFHATLLAGLLVMYPSQTRDERLKFGGWFALSAASLLLGNHFAPRYFLQLLPVMVITASHGIVIALHRWKRLSVVVLALLLIAPTIRFGSRYATLFADNLAHREPHWSDVALDLDSQNVAARIRALAKPGDTLFVWGYRPDMYVCTRMLPAGRFWDSQPLTGVPADRHLSVSEAVYAGPAAQNRQELVRTRPTFIVDGLGLLNPHLAPAVYPEVQAWLSNYNLVGTTQLSRIYRRR
jgi:hypothetical protein